MLAGSDTEYEDENQKSLKASKISRRQELDPKLRYLYGITQAHFVPLPFLIHQRALLP